MVAMNEKSRNVGFFCCFASSHLKVSVFHVIWRIQIFVIICIYLLQRNNLFMHKYIQQYVLHRILMCLHEPEELKISPSFSYFPRLVIPWTLTLNSPFAVEHVPCWCWATWNMKLNGGERLFGHTYFVSIVSCLKMYIVQKDLYMKMYVYNSYTCIVVCYLCVCHNFVVSIDLSFDQLPFEMTCQGNSEIRHAAFQVVSPVAVIWRSWGKQLAFPPGWLKALHISRWWAGMIEGKPKWEDAKTEVDASMNRIMTAPLEFDSWRHGKLKATMFCTSPWDGKGASN